MLNDNDKITLPVYILNDKIILNYISQELKSAGIRNRIGLTIPTITTQCESYILLDDDKIFITKLQPWIMQSDTESWLKNNQDSINHMILINDPKLIPESSPMLDSQCQLYRYG